MKIVEKLSNDHAKLTPEPLELHNMAYISHLNGYNAAIWELQIYRDKCKEWDSQYIAIENARQYLLRQVEDLNN